MRKSVELDQLLENAVAEALGLARPHPFAHRKLRAAPRKSRNGPRTISTSYREHARAAA